MPRGCPAPAAALLASLAWSEAAAMPADTAGLAAPARPGTCGGCSWGGSPGSRPATPGEEAGAAGEKAGAPGEKAAAVLARLPTPELPPKLGPRGEGEALRSWLPVATTGLAGASERPLPARARGGPEPNPPPPPNVNGRALTLRPPLLPLAPASRAERGEAWPPGPGRPDAAEPLPKAEPAVGLVYSVSGSRPKAPGAGLTGADWLPSGTGSAMPLLLPGRPPLL